MLHTCAGASKKPQAAGIGDVSERGSESWGMWREIGKHILFLLIAHMVACWGLAIVDVFYLPPSMSVEFRCLWVIFRQ